MMLLLVSSRTDPWMGLHEIKEGLEELGLQSEICYMSEIRPDDTFEEFSYFYIRSNCNVARSVFFFLKLRDIIPINSGAFENCYDRMSIKYKLGKHKIPTTEGLLMGIEYLERCKLQNDIFIEKDIFGRPNINHKIIYNPNNYQYREDEIIYFEKYLKAEDELKVYVIGRKIYSWNCKEDHDEAKELRPGPIYEVVQKVGKIFDLTFYSVDLILHNGKLYVIDVNQNPSYRRLTNRKEIFCSEIRRLINGSYNHR
jgi:hypothetical protein